MKITTTPTGLDTHRFPCDPWRLVEAEIGDDLGLTETLFGLGNGYLGMRANPDEGRDAHAHGTFVNGFHETWKIKHAEDAFAFAKTGQTIVNVPDAKLIKLYIDDEPLLIQSADLESYERAVDFRSGALERELIWQTPSGRRARVRSERIVSLEHRHLAVITFEVTMLDGDAPVVLSSQILNRQEGEDEYEVKAASLGEGMDPRKAQAFEHRVLNPEVQRHEHDEHGDDEIVLGYRCTNSGMTVAAGIRHVFEYDGFFEARTDVGPHRSKTVFTVDAVEGKTIRLTKFISYHTSTGVPARELADRCHRTLRRAERLGVDEIRTAQRAWLDWFWRRADIEIDGDPSAQQAVRWNLFQLAQASARVQEQGIGAKAVSGSGYEGHYFWDTEVYVIPFLALTDPGAAKKLLRFRWRMLDAARRRADEMAVAGALYPWRTINGEEASAYYAAGTAQYHINAAVVFAVKRYVDATGDEEFLAKEGVEILIETARMYEDLGFYHHNGERSFQIHGVTGPDEYTTVVNNNLYTNVMAQLNLRYAAETVEHLTETRPELVESLRRRLGLTDDEVAGWREAADAMYLPFDEELGIHQQDDVFLERERWPFELTRDDQYPLLLNFHPLVIYRHQVLKQADVVLAMFLRGEAFDLDQRRRNFDYYDPITTGDSSLSACVQAVVAAQVGHDELAFDYFRQALYVDLADTHGNASDGVHIASAGGVWAGVVHGFGGFHDAGAHLEFSPRLPEAWERAAFHVTHHDRLLRVELTGRTADGVAGGSVTLVEGDTVSVRGADGGIHEIAEGVSLEI